MGISFVPVFADVELPGDAIDELCTELVSSDVDSPGGVTLRFLRADFSINCDDAFHRNFIQSFYAPIMMMIYPLGVRLAAV